MNNVKLDTIKETLINISKQVNDDLTVNILEQCYIQRHYFYINALDVQSFDLRAIYMACYGISMLIKSVFSIDSKTVIVHHKNDIYIILKEIDTMRRYNFKIPYKHWTDYIEFVHKINQVVEPEGNVAIFVNNNVYNLECCLYVCTNNEQVLLIAQQYNVSLLKNGKSLEDYMIELNQKIWNTYALAPNMSLEEVKDVMTSKLFLFADYKELENRGYTFQNI